MSLRHALVCCSLLVACSRDLTLPPKPPVLPGAVFGRVVIAVPGRAERQPAKGAQVALLGSSLSVTAGEDGRFALTEVNQSAGKLLFRYVEGAHVRQKLVSLEDLGAGPNRQVSLGDVLVAENATVLGRALRSELAGSRTGHRGTVVFVPEGPFLTSTADDGSFEFTDLPEGAIELGFFRAGYLSMVLPALSLRGGEQLTLRDVVLAPDLNPAPGAILGSVSFAPPLEDASEAVAVATAEGFLRQGRAQPGGDFQLEDVPPGLYAVQLSRPAYSASTIFNVLVTSGQPTRLANVVLGQGATFDAGRPPEQPDASVLPGDGGMDAGLDAGPDAGADGGTDAGLDAGATGCTQQLDCALGSWCDDGFCAPQCTPGSCSNGRFCDPGTRTCLTSCALGCDAGLSCDLTLNACAPLCGGPVTCSAGFVCNPTTSLCESQCSTTRACPSHFTCNAGQCISLGTCDLDPDCPRTEVCLNGTCVPRSPDGGSACASPCECRLDETCAADAGQCVVVAPPTLFFLPDAGGTGASTTSPSGSLPDLASRATRGDVIALLAGTTATFAGPIALDGGVTLAGGYVDCGPGRWVRDDTSRSALEGGLTSIAFNGTPGAPRADVVLRNLSIASQPGGGISVAAVEVGQVERFTLDNVVPRLTGLISGTGFAFVRCTDCSNLRFSKVGLPPSPNALVALSLVRLINSSGAIDGLWVEDTTQAEFYGVYATTLTGGLSVTNSRFGVVSSGIVNGLVRVDACAAYPLTLTGTVTRWPNIGGSYEGRSVVVTNCDDLTLTDNLVDGRGQSARLRDDEPQSAAFSVYNSKGTVARNTVFFPSALQGGAVAFDLRGPQLELDFYDNVTDGGVNLTFATGVRIRGVTLGGLDVHDNRLGVHGAALVRGFDLQQIAGPGGLRIHDNEVRVDAPSTATAQGVFLADGVAGLFERNQVVVGASGISRGLSAGAGGAPSQVEVLQNLFRVGAGVAPGTFGVGSIGWELRAGGQYAFTGNSLDVNPDALQPGPSRAMVCGPLTGVFTSNVLGAGNKPGSTSVLHSDGVDCYGTATFTKNYAWYTAPALDANDQTATFFTADAGAFDGSGNVLAPNQSPYSAVGSFELGAGSLCIDRGVAGVRSDASPITLDALRRPRVVGTSADIGGAEKQ